MQVRNGPSSAADGGDSLLCPRPSALLRLSRYSSLGVGAFGLAAVGTPAAWPHHFGHGAMRYSSLKRSMGPECCKGLSAPRGNFGAFRATPGRTRLKLGQLRNHVGPFRAKLGPDSAASGLSLAKVGRLRSRSCRFRPYQGWSPRQIWHELPRARQDSVQFRKAVGADSNPRWGISALVGPRLKNIYLQYICPPHRAQLQSERRSLADSAANVTDCSSGVGQDHHTGAVRSLSNLVWGWCTSFIPRQLVSRC